MAISLPLHYLRHNNRMATWGNGDGPMKDGLSAGAYGQDLSIYPSGAKAPLVLQVLCTGWTLPAHDFCFGDSGFDNPA
jgi:hypothetical protein